MRELTVQEMELVCGGTGVCTPSDPSGNTYMGITKPEKIGEEIIAIYEGLVFATSHVIERVANAL